MLWKEMRRLKRGNNALRDSQQPQEILDFDNRGEGRKGRNISVSDRICFSASTYQVLLKGAFCPPPAEIGTKLILHTVSNITHCN